jgi:hypothetical protein
MRFAAVCMLFLLCFTLLTSCGKPKYWIEGLTLPPGSTEVSTIESDMTDPRMPPVPLPGKYKKILMVSFKNSGGWVAVSSHIDTCLTNAGYTGSSAGAGSPQAGAAMDMASMMRLYSKAGSSYSVMLQNMGGMLEIAKAQGTAPSGMASSMDAMGMGEFNLAVLLLDK